MENKDFIERMTQPSNPVAYNAAVELGQYLSSQGHTHITDILVEYDESEVKPTIRTELNYLLEESEENIERLYEFSNLTEDETRTLLPAWEEAFEENLLP